MHCPNRHWRICVHSELAVLSFCSYDITLGWDFLSNHQAVNDCSCAKVEFSLHPETCLHRLGDFDDKLVLTEETTIPPYSSVIVTACSNCVHDATALFVPLHISVCRRCSLPFTALTVSSGGTQSFVSVCDDVDCVACGCDDSVVKEPAGDADSYAAATTKAPVMTPENEDDHRP